MNKIPHSIFLTLTAFLLLCSTKVEAQYQNSNLNKMPLSFMSSQYWQHSYNAENDSGAIDASHWYLRVPHKLGIGLLLGGFGVLGGIGLGYGTQNLGVLVIMTPVGFVLGSSFGVLLVSEKYENEIPYGIIVLGGTVSFIGAYAIGEKIRKNSKNTSILPHLIGAVLLSLATEVFISEIDYSMFENDEEWDEYIYNDYDKLVFHEYVKSTQVFNFELFRIQF